VILLDSIKRSPLFGEIRRFTLLFAAIRRHLQQAARHSHQY
jgi:hypothetical protein